LFQEKVENRNNTFKYTGKSHCTLYNDAYFYNRMERKKIHELIKELKNLQLREAEITAQIDEENAVLSGHRRTTVEHDFDKGDRVRVKNQVKKPNNWGNDVWNYQQARVATVIFTTTDRVYFVTDNGIRTWRAPHNLERIEP
jgi:hypothetical protein